MLHKTAVIIKGNPAFVKHNPVADAFYTELEHFLESLGYRVIFDPGEPYTQPPDANVWIGHSRGVDRLEFAPEGTVTIAIGIEGGINHPLDQSLKAGDVPDRYHFLLTEEMRSAIAEMIKRGRS